MKKKITTEQWNELSEVKKDCVIYWTCLRTNKNGGHCCIVPTAGMLPGFTMDIGDMIEFLQTYKEDRRYKTKYPKTIEFCQEPAEYDETWYIQPDTLCDDLWGAVKDLLKKIK